MAVKDAAPPKGARIDTEVPAGIKRDQYGRPVIRGQAYTRSSTFGEALEDTYGVNMWGRGMIAYGMGKREDLRLKAAGIPGPCGAPDTASHTCHPPCVESKEGKRELAEIREAAYAASGADRKSNLGTALHSLTHQIDEGIEIGHQGPKWDPILERYRELIAGFRVIRSEVFTVCEKWLTAGTFDFWLEPLGWLKAPDGEVFGPGLGKTLIGDKKTSATSKYFGAKFACQTRTYRDGDIVDVRTKEPIGWPEAEQPSATWGLILHLPSDVQLLDDAGWYWVNLAAAVDLCELARSVRKVRNRRDLIVPVAGLPTAQHPDDTKRAAAFAKIDAAKSVAALKMVARSYSDVWTPELRDAARARAAWVEANRPAEAAS